jgi:hypothetical protein
VRRFRNLEPVRLLGVALAGIFLLLLIGALVAAATGGLGWQGALSAVIAAVIAVLGLLYAWRLGAPGRRE